MISNAINRIKRGIDISVEVNDETAIDELKFVLEVLENKLTDKWTPVSEKLPEHEDKYDVTVKTIDGFPNIMPGAITTVRMVYVGGKWKNEWFHEVPFWEVIAWRPLQDPYKED